MTYDVRAAIPYIVIAILLGVIIFSMYRALVRRDELIDSLRKINQMNRMEIENHKDTIKSLTDELERLKRTTT